MSVVVAHQVSPTGSLVLTQGAREANLRRTNLMVVHVVESLDLDQEEAQRSGLSDEIRQVVEEGGFTDLDWDVHLATGSDDLPGTVVELADQFDAELVVIGARRRSPLGKLLLGSSAQSIILDANVPVLVVKAKAPTD